MACLQVKCPNPKCKKLNSERAKVCKCGFALAKHSGKTYYTQYTTPEGKKKRERIGPNREAAAYRLRKVLNDITEGRYIERSPDARTLFKTLAAWYLELPEVQAKRSYDRDRQSLNRLLPFFSDRLLKDINPALVEAYRQKRLSEPSGRSPKNLTKPATVNREIALFKTIFNKATKNGKAERNPAQGIKRLKENNERGRILSPHEYTLLLTHCPAHLKPVLKVAYYTSMRQGEILNLTWGQVDLKEEFIKLAPEHCKSNEGRLVPLNRELVAMFKAMPKGLPGVSVFTYEGRSVGSIKRSFEAAVKKAGIEDFTFHDLRHTAINNWRLQGHDYFRIMAASGHTTMSVFKRYNTVSQEELKALVGEKI